MRHFIVTLQHDSGTFRCRTWASTWWRAVEAVLNHELAPVSSLLSVEEYQKAGVLKQETEEKEKYSFDDDF